MISEAELTKENHLENLKAANAGNETELGDKIDVLRDVALSLWKEVQSLGSSVNVTNIERGIKLYDEVRRFEVDLIERALDQTGGNQTRAARLLDINLTTLNSKIKRYNICTGDEEEEAPALDAEEVGASA
ncbi:MAG: helix-turn-helix domain-containing protein [Pyrinomonadaceae bacterium]|nr:helix-turn-helix domain-containing protein [Pyrinomonadaceae bacterium]